MLLHLLACLSVVFYMLCHGVFCFKQKTAYEWRISDWSSDVCSSDLLSHSACAIPVDLNGANADFAVGCGYKFLNGGPGAPAYLFAAARHRAATPILSGWFGHARPFSFEEDYDPAPGIERFLCGTPPVLGLAALETGVDLLLEADRTELRRKSLALGDLFMEHMAPLCARSGFTLVRDRKSVV